jgi:hypothetical protein
MIFKYFNDKLFEKILFFFVLQKILWPFNYDIYYSSNTIKNLKSHAISINPTPILAGVAYSNGRFQQSARRSLKSSEQMSPVLQLFIMLDVNNLSQKLAIKFHISTKKYQFFPCRQFLHNENHKFLIIKITLWRGKFSTL